MERMTLFLGEPFQREKASEKKIKSWKEELGEPELHKFEGDDLDLPQLSEALQTKSLFGSKTLIHFTRIGEVEDKKTCSQVIKKAPSSENLAILAEGESLSGNSALYKIFEKRGTVEKFDKPNKKNLPKYLNRMLNAAQVELTGQAKRWFLQVMDPDLVRISHEIRKLEYLESEAPLTKEKLQQVVWAGGQGKIFQFLDHFSSRELPEALRSLKQLLDEETPPGKVFYMLAGELRLLLSVKSLAKEGASNKQIARKTGKYNWLISKKRNQVENFSRPELIGLLQRLSQFDIEVKTGQKELSDAILEAVYSISPS